MRVLDVNVLLYAVNTAADRHREASTWLEQAARGHETLGLDWMVLVGFLRMSTNPVIQPHPLSLETATGMVDDWLRLPNVVLLRPRSGHTRRMGELLSETGTGGNLVNDAHLAALALEHKATVVTYDNDFSRFPGVRWETPRS